MGREAPPAPEAARDALPNRASPFALLGAPGPQYFQVPESESEPTLSASDVTITLSLSVIDVTEKGRIRTPPWPRTPMAGFLHREAFNLMPSSGLRCCYFAPTLAPQILEARIILIRWPEHLQSRGHATVLFQSSR